MTKHSTRFLMLCSVLFSSTSEGWNNPTSTIISSSLQHQHSASSRFNVKNGRRSSDVVLHAFSYFDGDDNNGGPSGRNPNQSQPQRGMSERNSKPIIAPVTPSQDRAPPLAPMRRSSSSGMSQITPLDRSQSSSLSRRRSEPKQEIYGDYDVKPTIIQGNSLRTWSFTTNQIQSVQVSLFTEGRPLKANVDVWTGPDSTPQKMSVYLEDGSIRPFNAVVFVPRSIGGQKHAVAVKNTGHMEFPISAAVEVGSIFASQAFSMDEVAQNLFATHKGKTIQGGSVKTIPFSPSVASIQLLLTSDGRPLNARIEMLQGPNNVKQIMEIHTEDGNARPFFAIIETPGYGNVVRIVNTGPMEFPIECRLEPYTVEDDGMMFDMMDNDDTFGPRPPPRRGNGGRDDLFFLKSGR